MATEAKKYSGTRLYGMDGNTVMHPNDNLARKLDVSAPARPYAEPKRTPAQRPEVKPHESPAPLTREQVKHRAAVTLSVFALGALLFSVIWGFAAVTQAFNGVNALKTQIEETTKSINDLNLQVEQGVNLNDIISGAENSGYILPDSGNVVGAQP